MRRTWLAVIYLSLAACVAAPVLAIHAAGLGDMLNHLARMHVLATIDTSPDLQRFYVVRWAPIPYLAMDAIVPVLLHVMPIYAAGRLFVLLCLLMPPAAAFALHYAIHRRLSLVPAAAFLLSYNQLVSLGFLNYLFTSGLAVLLFAGWVATACWPRWRRAAAFAPLVTALYVGHAFACLAYCLCVAGWEGARAIRARPVFAPSVLADVAAAGLQAVPAMALAATLDLGAGYEGELHTAFGGVAEKLVALASPMMFKPDPAGAAALAGALLLAGGLASRLRIAAALWPSLLLVGLVALAVPHVMASTWGTDLRLPMIVALLVIGGTSLAPAPAGRAFRWKAAWAMALLLLVAVKSADAWVVLDRVDSWIGEARRLVAQVPRGSRLLVVDAHPADGQSGAHSPWAEPSTIWQLPLVATIDRDAAVPYLFTGLSTVQVRPAWRASSTPNGFPITPAQLQAGLAEADVPGQARRDGTSGRRLYHYGWPQKFDYVLVQRFGADPGTLPTMLEPVGHAPDMDLYRIHP